MLPIFWRMPIPCPFPIRCSDSVVYYLRGDIGIPPGGFPESLPIKVLQSRGLEPVVGRPGESLTPFDFEKAKAVLEKKFGGMFILTDQDVLSYALYPQVYNEFKLFRATLGQVGLLPTHIFLNPMKPGEEVDFELEEGKDLLLKLVSIGDVNKEGMRTVLFEVNGEPWYLPVTDLSSEGERKVREKAANDGDVGAPMPGVVVGLKVHVGDKVKEGEAVATLSAMKMESSIPATASGTVKRVLVNVGDKVEGDDLILTIE
mmetsp:Transcript_18588/g.23940  ORF Transcript_18588/g.23940 Transcript_18588/m.23940 type:complete len:259 (+) Transcript_18588:78-854(+)